MARAGHVARALLDLAGTAQAQPVPALDAAEWQALAALAALHRMGPWLHHRHQASDAVPPAIRREWADAYRIAALRSLSQHADAATALRLLETAGYAPIALKGAFLQRHAYPDMALRPMRDIDILVEAERVLPAFDLLRDNGFVMEAAGKLSLEDAARLDKHMPALTMPLGTVLELHARLMDRDGRLEYATPAGDDHGVRARAVTLDGLRYPAPADMLAHLVGHAVYGHRFDCGPLVLTDIHFLTARHPVDWDLFWGRAQAEGWAPGAALVLALVRHYHGDAGLPRHADEPAGPDAATIDLTRDLMLQDWTVKKNPRFLATLLSGGLGKARRQAAGRVHLADQDTAVVDRTQDGGQLAFLWLKLRGMAATLADPAQRRQARQLAQFRRWLEG